jgi:ATP dependent DNA ligase domain
VSIIRFIEPMLLLQTDKLPEGAAWLHEVKLDGYRAIAGRSGNSILFRSRRNNDFTRKFPSIAKAFRILPDETLVDGEVAPWCFTTQQNTRFPSAPARSIPRPEALRLERRIDSPRNAGGQNQANQFVYATSEVAGRCRWKTRNHLGVRMPGGSLGRGGQFRVLTRAFSKT